MANYILGVDAGGTKSHLVIFDRNGQCASATTYGPLNHEVMEGSYAELEERLLEVIPRTLQDAGITADDVAYAVFGVAGVDTKAQMKLVSDMVTKTGLKHFTVCNDAVLGVPAGSPDCVGICAISGTGFKVAAIDYSGVSLDICGLGSYTDDRGGGSWFGLRACGEVYNYLYRLGQKTVMKDMLFELLGISDKGEYLDVITENLYGGANLYNSVDLNSIAFRAAAQGDEVALGILRESATQYAGAIARLATDMDFPADKVLNVTLAGSVFVKQQVKIVPEMIKELVAKALGGREVTYTMLEAPPVAGAVLWAAQKAGFEFDAAAVEKGLRKL
ncbi:MAG: hypothetical protein FWD44_04660 [Oscillospiraceae bacterium]|nr:hypothetical protein [Oscillospiraceae bacterium]